jgi:uncharacterized protein YjiS (DUF1127 family)
MTIQSSTAGNTSLPGIVFNYIAGAIRAAAARRSQRIALRELLAMSPARLRDLGINAGDVIEALEAAPQAGAKLTARRADRADHWLGLGEPRAA